MIQKSTPPVPFAPPGTRFPAAWLWLVDEAIPAHVKRHYSPMESWKDKPFDKKDAIFFSKGVNDLSELFTDERPSDIPNYFLQPKFRSGYLLYFLPLQAAKFSTLFQIHAKAIDEALRHAREKNGGTLRVLDLGAGPGTASLALLLHLLDSKLAEQLPEKIELEWWDTNAKILADGKELAEFLASRFPKLRGKVSVRYEVGDWKNAKPKQATSLVLMGHVLNEAREAAFAPVARLLETAEGGGILIVEPASRPTAQRLSRIRDELFENDVLAADAKSLWGPCLHSGRCPLGAGRDWCHFSVPLEIPGEWFKSFSRGLGSERTWLKFSYLWIAAKSAPGLAPPKGRLRIVSDTLMRRDSDAAMFLTCEPEEVGRITLPAIFRAHRGDLVAGSARPPGTKPSRPKREEPSTEGDEFYSESDDDDEA